MTRGLPMVILRVSVLLSYTFVLLDVLLFQCTRFVRTASLLLLCPLPCPHISADSVSCRRAYDEVITDQWMDMNDWNSSAHYIVNRDA